MRIGLYGLPCAGKTFILDRVRNFTGLSGSSLLNEIAPDFTSLDENEKEAARKKLAIRLITENNFIMDGHYAFGDKVVFTKEDGQLYDAFIYLYVAPEVLMKRMSESEKNRKYLKHDIQKWQDEEVLMLRKYCHEHDKDFYVVDNPKEGYFSDISMVLEFINSIAAGFSCVKFARDIAYKAKGYKNVSLTDGDRTLIKEDSSMAYGYKTHIFDNNFYTGFQSWLHDRKFHDFLRLADNEVCEVENMKLTVNEKVVQKMNGLPVILTSGYFGVWSILADRLKMQMFYGSQMCADTKYFVTKFLQENGTRVTALGDSMNDYYMLRQADESYIIPKDNGRISSSLKDKDMEGISWLN